MMRLSMLLMLACAESTLPSPPPGNGGLDLTIDGAFVSGELLTFTATGAQPGDDVYLLFGTREAPDVLCPPQLSGLCMDVGIGSGPGRVLSIPGNPSTADASGQATWTVAVPPRALITPGTEVWFQAAVGGANAALSTPTSWSRLQDSGLLIMGILEVADVGATYNGERTTYLQSVSSGETLCTITESATGTDLGGLPDCVGCSFAFEVTYSSPVASPPGVCGFLLGGPPPQSPTIGVGFHPSYGIRGYGAYPSTMFHTPATGRWSFGTLATYYQYGQSAWLVEFVGYYGY